MDYLQFASEALVSSVGLAGLVLSAFHVKNANAVASDAVATMSDAIAAMHGNLTGIVAKLVAASPMLVSDGMRLMGDATASLASDKPAAPVQVVADAVTVAAKA